MFVQESLNEGLMLPLKKQKSAALTKGFEFGWDKILVLAYALEVISAINGDAVLFVAYVLMNSLL